MNYLILGANAAGMSAAVRILKFDKTANITVLEKSDVVSFGACGIPYFVGGEFKDIEQMTARSLAEFTQIGIDVRCLHTVTGLDAASKTVTAVNAEQQTQTFTYDKLLIAVGASPVQPPIQGLNTQNVFTMHSKRDAQLIVDQLEQVQNVVVIGNGFIGLEASEALREQGKNVTLIGLSGRVLETIFDAEISTILEDSLQRHGVNLRNSEMVTELVSEQGRVHQVVSNLGQYPADMVIVAAGFKPNTDFLASSGLTLSAQGAIVIDAQCQTNLPDVYAAGDCATVPHRISGTAYIPLATTANKLGRIVGEVMAGQPSQFIGTLGSSGIRVFDIEAGRTGITEQEAQQQNIDYRTVWIKDKNHTDYVAAQSEMWVKLIYERSTRRLLGGQVCGAYLGGAVHRVDALAVAVYSGITVEELGFMDFIYAPPFARTWNVLNIAGNVAK
ncbi:CoA-disulfide reductase [Deefgea salmonis]|uniref:CoA-disulfide reductase n=1 Tax=Deefgea salmonis TaxID=2875502 RepID=A0ABS8BNU5_9NEIS|nr:CoA-disulfide reductase [Deefgea salmonis]MCB5197402.1 CoA-disulfide reductase [Deefgea salmonis]